jgi:hypothetical protein
VERDDPIELKEVSLTADAGEDAVLDITLHDRTLNPDDNTVLYVEIERIRAGDDVDVVINDSKAGNDPSTINGVTVETFNPPDRTNPLTGPVDDPNNRTGSFFRYWSPDEDGGEDYYDFIARSLNTDEDYIDEVDSTYVFVEVRAGDDIDIGHVTTNDDYPDSLPGEENRSYRTTDISYGTMDSETKTTPITVTPAASSTTVNFIIFTDVDTSTINTDLEEDEDDGGEQIFLTTNGFIQAQELLGDMLVGHIHSTDNDVTLWSGAQILDANGTASVDVTGVNITMYSGVATGAYSDNDVLDLLLGQHDGETAGGLLIPNGTQNPSAGGIGRYDDFLEINVDRNDSGGKLDAFDTNASTTHDGIFIDELTGDLRVGLVETIENVSLRTVAGSIVDADNETDADVIGDTIDLDANGLNASIGSIGNDLDINSFDGLSEVDFYDDAARDAALNDTDPTTGLDDVSLEASDNIYLRETDGALRLALAHTYYGDIWLTVRDTSDLDEHLYLINDGEARFAESDNRNPGSQQDATRDIPNGTIFAERGAVTLYVGDNIAFDPNADVLAAHNISIYGDANFTDGANNGSDPDSSLALDYGTTMILRGRIIAGAHVTAGNDGYSSGQMMDPAMGSAIASYGAPAYTTRIFGNDDVDTIQFGDEGGIAGGTAQDDAGFIYLGSKTRAYGSQNLPLDRLGTNGKDLSLGNDSEDRLIVFYLQDTATVTSPSQVSNPLYEDGGSTDDSLKDLTDLGWQNAEHTLTLDGQAYTDYYEIHTTGSTGDYRNYIINVLDTGEDDDGVDELHILSPAASLVDPDATDDIYLLRAMQDIDNENVDRAGFVAVLHGTLAPYQDIVQFNEDSPEVQRIQYDSGLNGRLIVEGREGDDSFFSDDVTVITTLDGGEGNDSFQVGQIFGQNRTTEANMLPNDIFPELVATTRGWLSPGSSAPMPRAARAMTSSASIRTKPN